jgi:hypothetical protein
VGARADADIDSGAATIRVGESRGMEGGFSAPGRQPVRPSSS